jgi:hypothetical protein
MFAKAYKINSEFTRPVVISAQRANGKCDASVGTFIHVNDEGWIMTAAHILALDHELRSGRSTLATYNAERERIEKATLSAKARRTQLQALGKRPEHLAIDHSFWWSQDGCTLVDIAVLELADLAIGRLEPWDPSWCKSFPTFKDPAQETGCGTSLCRLGYPFAQLTPTYVGGNFSLPADVHKMPRFPIEGILTRHVRVGTHPAGYKVGFIETSSPGLKGQSGGPIFDQQGTVWGIQSRTAHLDLGFSPQIPNGNPEQVEHQFLNVGWATHPETIVGLLKERGVNFALSAY